MNESHGSSPPPREYVRASPWRRLAAFCYDLLLLAALLFCFALVVLALRKGQPVPPGTLWFEIALLGVALAFFCGFWAHGGQTLGMRAWGIRVITANGQRLGLARAALRFGAALVGLLGGGVGLWWCLIDRDGRTLPDLWTQTRVIRAEPERR